MSTPTSHSDLVQFLDRTAKMGWLNKSTAGVTKSNLNRVFSCLDVSEKDNVLGLDLDSVIRRFANLNPDVAPQSLRDYRSRIERVLELYRQHKADPVSFRVPKGRRKTRGSETTSKRPFKPSVPSAPAGSTSIATGPMAVPVHGMSYLFPLRPDCTVAITNLPRDLKQAEAERLAVFLRLLAQDYKAS